MLDLGLSRFSCNLHRFCLNIIFLYTRRFLMLSIGTLRMHLVTRGYTRMQIKKVYQAYVQSDTKIVVLAEQ